MNLNLQANSVGIYQISKLACIPITLAIQYVFYNQTISTNIAWTLAPLSLGVYLATVYDVEANFTGTIFAICAVLATSLAQIFTR
jgi:solute carrier family 35 protein E3